MPRTWQNQFPDDYRPPDQLTSWLSNQSAFTDTSWGNDVCPSFSATLKCINEEALVRLWVDHEDPAQREGQSHRYAIVIYPEGAGEPNIPVLAMDDLDMALETAEWTVKMATSVYNEMGCMLSVGQLPPDIKSFSDVHDYYDGNVLGDFEEGCEYFEKKFGRLNCEEYGKEWDACRDLFFDICNAIQALMDWWIKNKMKGSRS